MTNITDCLLVQGSANFVYKGPYGKYFRFYVLHCLHCNHHRPYVKKQMCLCSTNVIFSTINGTDAFWAMLCEHFHFILFYFISFYNFFIFLRFHSFIFSDKGRQGEREGEKHQGVVSHVLPEGTGPKPRHVPDGFTAPTGVARWAGNRLVGG